MVGCVDAYVIYLTGEQLSVIANQKEIIIAISRF